MNIWWSTSESANSTSKQKDFYKNKKYAKVINPLFSGARVVKHIEIRNNYIKTQNLKVNIMKKKFASTPTKRVCLFRKRNSKKCGDKDARYFSEYHYWKTEIISIRENFISKTFPLPHFLIPNIFEQNQISLWNSPEIYLYSKRFWWWESWTFVKEQKNSKHTFLDKTQKSKRDRDISVDFWLYRDVFLFRVSMFCETRKYH